MTSSALTTNREWNTKIVSTEQGEYTHNVVEEFDQLWNSEQVLPLKNLLKDIQILIQEIRLFKNRRN